MDDLARDEIPPWRLMHLPLLTALGASAAILGLWVRYEPYGLVFSLVKVSAAVVPVYLATLGYSTPGVFVRSIITHVALFEACELSDGAHIVSSLPGNVAALMLIGAGWATAGFCFTWPVVALARYARTRPHERVLANELLLLGCYGLALRLNPAMERAIQADALYACVAKGAMAATTLATLAVALVGIAWELSARLRVRAVLADTVPGWRALPVHEVPGAERVPLLRWLEWMGWLANRPARAETLRVIVRSPDALLEPTYRAQAGHGAPRVRVPAEISLLHERVFANALVAVCAARALEQLWSNRIR